RADAGRKEVASAATNIKAALATNRADRHRLEAILGDYIRWLHDTADHSILEEHSRIEAEHERLRGLSNEGGPRSAFYERRGQLAACRWAMSVVLALREEYCPDLPARFERLRKEMAEFAQRRAAEIESVELAE